VKKLRNAFTEDYVQFVELRDNIARKFNGAAKISIPTTEKVDEALREIKKSLFGLKQILKRNESKPVEIRNLQY